MRGDSDERERGCISMLVSQFEVNAVVHRAAVEGIEANGESLVNTTQAESTRTAGIVSIHVRAGSGHPCIRRVIHDVSFFGSGGYRRDHSATRRNDAGY